MCKVVQSVVVKAGRKCRPYDQKETKTCYFAQVQSVHGPRRLLWKMELNELANEKRRKDGTAELLENVSVKLPNSIRSRDEAVKS